MNDDNYLSDDQQVIDNAIDALGDLLANRRGWTIDAITMDEKNIEKCGYFSVRLGTLSHLIEKMINRLDSEVEEQIQEPTIEERIERMMELDVKPSMFKIDHGKYYVTLLTQIRGYDYSFEIIDCEDHTEDEITQAINNVKSKLSSYGYNL